jgi:hypothetical protein
VVMKVCNSMIAIALDVALFPCRNKKSAVWGRLVAKTTGNSVTQPENLSRAFSAVSLAARSRFRLKHRVQAVTEELYARAADRGAKSGGEDGLGICAVLVAQAQDDKGGVCWASRNGRLRRAWTSRG